MTIFIALCSCSLSRYVVYREEVTCVYCLPLLSYKQSSQGAPEWTCVIVGFNTGHVRMYDEVSWVKSYNFLVKEYKNDGPNIFCRCLQGLQYRSVNNICPRLYQENSFLNICIIIYALALNLAIYLKLSLHVIFTSRREDDSWLLHYIYCVTFIPLAREGETRNILVICHTQCHNIEKMKPLLLVLDWDKGTRSDDT